MNALILARIQFATNITFHILFPTITIALGWFLLFFKWRFNATGEFKWMEIYKFWIKIFALCFALGVVSGVTMSFQFGTNWPGFMQTVGNIAGPLLAYEVLTAFFLEATFLGIMLFGFNKVSNRVHTIATVLVAVGTTLSAFWILVLNSWMQTPQGFEMIDGKAYATDWWAILFNPSLPYRLVHMLLGSGLTASFLIAGLSAYRWIRHEKTENVLSALKTGVYTAALLIPVQIFVGDLHGLNTLKYQPAKVAAIEGLWETRADVPLLVFAIPDEKAQINHFEIEIPGLASLILTHTRQGEIRGLKEFAPYHPPVAPVFFSFRIMVGVGLLMLAVSWMGVWRLRRWGTPSGLLSWSLVAMTFSGWIAVVAGWYVTEIGRQPWLVSNLLMTAQATAPVVTAEMIWISLTMYVVLYLILIFSFISVVFYLARQGVKSVLPEPSVGSSIG